ncbi:MAG: hypothetical protein DMF98_21820 [Acidobacteria bacterium]|nr:MAG: hypothetical protein DMF98_21820 [Acidobacteriota bacterium]
MPHDGLAELAVVGRSNVGKSTLINALVRQRLARTSAAPGKTRLANVYHIARAGARPFYLVDLPGYGFAGGGPAAAREFEELTRAIFGRDGRDRRDRQDGKAAPATCPRNCRVASRRRAPSWSRERRGGVAVAARHRRRGGHRRHKNRQTGARRADPRTQGIRIRA